MHKIVESTQRLVDRSRRIEPMELIEVDVVGLQTAEGSVNGIEDVLSGVAAVER